jgi:hypothetical protein
VGIQFSVPIQKSAGLLTLLFCQPKRPLQSWLWHSLIGYHVIQFFLFLGLFIPRFNIWTGWFSSWLIRDKTISVDDSLNVFNIDCKVFSLSLFLRTLLYADARTATVSTLHHRMGGTISTRPVLLT